MKLTLCALPLHVELRICPTDRHLLVISTYTLCRFSKYSVLCAKPTWSCHIHSDASQASAGFGKQIPLVAGSLGDVEARQHQVIADSPRKLVDNGLSNLTSAPNNQGPWLVVAAQHQAI